MFWHTPSLFLLKLRQSPLIIKQKTPKMEQKIKNLIAETLDYILKNPAIFFSEADVQAIFWSRLMTDPALNLHKLHDTSCTIGTTLNSQ
jgi:hypothetical protein